MVVGKSAVPLGTGGNQQPDHVGFVQKQPLCVDVGHVVEPGGRLEDRRRVSSLILKSLRPFSTFDTVQVERPTLAASSRMLQFFFFSTDLRQRS